MILPLLILGGLYLCYEGFEKLARKFFHSEAQDEAHIDLLEEKLADPATDMVEYEKDKIRGCFSRLRRKSGESPRPD